MLTKRSNPQKDLIQERALISSRKHNHLVLEWSTGCGKTLAAVKILDEALKNNPNAKCYIVCKEKTHVKNWVEDITRHKYDYMLEKLEFILYASLHKCTESDIIVFDECHALTHKKQQYAMNMIKANTKCVYLSATIPDHKRFIISSLSVYKAKYYTITLTDAIDMGLLPEPKVIVHPIKLDNGGNKYHHYVIKKSKKGPTIYCTPHNRWEKWKHYSKAMKEFTLVMKCNEWEYYAEISKDMGYWYDRSQNGSEAQRRAAHNKFLNLGSQRKKFIAKVKGERVKKLVQDFRQNSFRFICFTGSIEQCKELGAGSAVHSGNDDQVNQDIIDCFNFESCDELFAVKMLRESVNLTNIEKGIIVQLDSTIGSFYQMLGRCLRHEFPEMHLLILEGTQDEQYFETALGDFDQRFIEYGEDHY